MAVDPDKLHSGIASDEKTGLYRQFDADGVLLYVGASVAPTSRFACHRSVSGWYQQVVRIEIQWFPTYMEAIEAERIAIQDENPKFNRMRYNGGVVELSTAALNKRALRARLKAKA